MSEAASGAVPAGAQCKPPGAQPQCLPCSPCPSSPLPALPSPALLSAHHEAKVEEEHDWRHEHQHRAQLELGVRVEGEQGKGGGQSDGKLQQVGDDEADELQEAAEPDGEGLRCTGGPARRSKVRRRSEERMGAWQRVGNRVRRWWAAGTADALLLVPPNDHTCNACKAMRHSRRAIPSPCPSRRRRARGCSRHPTQPRGHHQIHHRQSPATCRPCGAPWAECAWPCRQWCVTGR